MTHHEIAGSATTRVAELRGVTVISPVTKALTPIQAAAERVAVERDRDLERVYRGEITAAELGRQNGGFGRVIGSGQPVGWLRSANAV